MISSVGFQSAATGFVLTIVIPGRTEGASPESRNTV
jgi:hypothetical protein